jgi:two-component system chemotaxis response regulator CheB
MSFEHLVVIGASAGGIDAVKAIVSRVDGDFPAPICAVLHVSPSSPNLLPAIVSRAGAVPAELARSGAPLEPGRMYVAPADHHLTVEPGRLRISRGPKENRFRPAIDPLFRSAAQVYGPRVIGVVLTGGLDDGTAGLWTIKQLGGVTIVQDPAGAVEPSMPRSALRHVQVDHVAPIEEIGPLLNRLVRVSVYERPMRPGAALLTEVRIAEGGDPMEAGVQKLGTPSMFACPECHGVLSEVSEGPLVRYRCHTGHAYSRATLQAEQNEQVETTLYNAMRALDERLLMLDQLARHEPDVANAGHLKDALARAREAAATVRNLIASTELKPEAEPHG